MLWEAVCFQRAGARTDNRGLCIGDELVVSDQQGTGQAVPIARVGVGEGYDL